MKNSTKEKKNNMNKKNKRKNKRNPMRKKGRIKRNTVCVYQNVCPKIQSQPPKERMKECCCCLGKENHRIPKVSEEVHCKKQREDLLTNRCRRELKNHTRELKSKQNLILRTEVEAITPKSNQNNQIPKSAQQHSSKSNN